MEDGWFKFNTLSNGCMTVPMVQMVCSISPSFGRQVILDQINYITYSATWGVISKQKLMNTLSQTSASS